MAQAVDIREAIQRSTSEVSIQDLSKKGFKQVKVLNQAAITRLIAEAVDRVISQRLAEVSEAERGKVIAESRREFDVLAKQRVEEQSRLQQLLVAKEQLEERVAVLQGRVDASVQVQIERDQARAELAALESRVSDLQARLAERGSGDSALAEESKALRQRLAESEKVAAVLQGRLEAKTEELDRLRETGSQSFERLARELEERIDSIRSSQTSDTTDEIRQSLVGIQQNIQNIASGSVAIRKGDACDAEALVRFAELGLSDGAMETNMDEVEIKESKSSGVKNSLAKLKALQRGAKGQE